MLYDYIKSEISMHLLIFQVSEPNRKKRIDFTNALQTSEDNLQDILFTDECSVQLDSNRKLCFRKVNK